MTDITGLSDELAEEYSVPEPEIWGTLAVLHAQGLTEEQARQLIENEYGTAAGSA